MVRASLIWLNYNSSRFIDIALKSIDSILNLDFDNYEIVIVDNASTDGSFEAIKKFVEEKKPSNVRVRFARSDYNRGYAGGMNLGWEARDRDTEYVAFLNNDLIVEPESLRDIIEHMEGDEKTVAANGLIHFGDGKTIYSAGGFGTEGWAFGNICEGAIESSCSGLDKPHYITFPSGAYVVVKARAISEVGPQGRPFIDETFLYLDDCLLGLILWNRGYRVTYVPVKAGLHHAGMTTKSVSSYYGTRNKIAIVKTVNTRYSVLRPIYLFERGIGYRLLCIFSKKYCNLYKAYVDGHKLAEIIYERLGMKLDLYKAPYVKISSIEFASNYLFLIYTLSSRIITFDDLLLNVS